METGSGQIAASPSVEGRSSIWNAAPLSSYARCEETWIDGIRYYDRDEAAEIHAEAMLERGKLLAKASGGASDDDPEAGERSGRRGRPTPGASCSATC